MEIEKRLEQLKQKIELAKADIAEAEFAKKHAMSKIKTFGADAITQAREILSDLIKERKKQQEQLEHQLNEFEHRYKELLEN
jgi:hypothetical protein